MQCALNQVGSQALSSLYYRLGGWVGENFKEGITITQVNQVHSMTSLNPPARYLIQYFYINKKGYVAVFRFNEL